MSKTIDQRVVEMRFDNKMFESNVQTSMSTIEKLKRSLNFTGASKGFENINTAAKKCDMSGLETGVESVSLKFYALEVMAVAALFNITNAAMNAGKKIVKALALDSVFDGFKEYELKMNSVQTIMSNTASKGTTMSDVTRVLDDLNRYADKTIYNFAEMTRNIGTFTAAGVGLEESAKAIQGIANLAAASGSSSMQASTAMYQLSQALATGTVKLMDWNSVVNAGMGGEKFQEALKATARTHGVAVDEMIERNGSFRDSLHEGWLSADILNETLSNFTVEGATKYAESMMEAGKWTREQADALIEEAQAMEDAATKVKTFTQLWDTLKEAAGSGWAQTWEIIIGDFEEAKEVFTEISDVLSEMVNASSDARNALLQDGLTSGWKQFLSEGITDEVKFIESVKKVAKEHGVAIDEMIKKEGSFEKTLKDGWLNADILGESLERLTDEVKGLSDEQLKAKGYTRDQADAILELNDKVKDGSVSLEEYAEKMTMISGRENLIQSLRNAFEGVNSVVTPVIEAFKEIFPPVTAEQIYNFTEALKELTSKMKLSDDSSEKLKNTFKGLFAVVKIVKDIFIGMFEVVKPFLGLLSILGSVVLSITSFFGNFLMKLTGVSIDMSKVSDATGQMKNGVVDAMAGMKRAIDNSRLIEFFRNLWEVVKLATDIITDALGTIANTITKTFNDTNFDAVFDILNTLSLGTIAVWITKILKSVRDPFEVFSNILEGAAEKLVDVTGILDSITGVLDGVRSSLESYQQNIKANVLLKIAAAIGILAVSLLIISQIDSKKLTSSLGAIAVLFMELIAAISLISNLKGMKGASKIISLMIGISIAISILAGAMKTLSGLDWEGIAKGLISIASLMGMLVLATKAMSSNTGKMMKGAANIVIFALAIKVLASAVKDISTLSWSELTKGLIGVGILLTEISLFCKYTKFSGMMMPAAIGMVILASAIKILASATRDLGGLSWEEMGRGLLGIAGALVIISTAVNLMPSNILLIGVGLIAAAAAISILSSALTSMGGMSWEGLAKGLIALGGSLAVLAIGLHAMNGTLAGSAALLVAAGAVMIFAPALLMLGNMSWESIAKGLIVLAGSFVIFGVAGAALTPVIPAILALGGALALSGIGIAAIGAGLVAAGIGLQYIAVGFGMLATLGAAGVAAVTSGLTSIVKGIAGTITTILTNLAKGLVAFVETLASNATQIASAVATIGQAIITSLIELIPLVVDGLMQLVTGFLETLVVQVPIVIQAFLDLLLQFLTVIAENIPLFIQAGVDIIVAFLNGIASELPRIVDAAFQLIISFINGLAESIRVNTPLLIAAIQNLFSAVIEAGLAILTGSVDGFLGAGDTIMNSGLIQGVRNNIESLKTAFSNAVTQAKDRVIEMAEDFMSAGRALIDGIISGVMEGARSLVDAAAGVVTDALNAARNALDINSPSKKAIPLGISFDEGIIVGLKKYSSKVSGAAKNVVGNVLDTTKKVLSGAKTLVDLGMNMQPSIRPVLDLTDIKNNAHQIDGLFGQRSVSLATTVGSQIRNGVSILDSIGDVIKTSIESVQDKIDEPGNSTYVLEVPVYLEGREIAKASAPYTQKELDRINKFQTRMGGVL